MLKQLLTILATAIILSSCSNRAPNDVAINRLEEKIDLIARLALMEDFLRGQENASKTLQAGVVYSVTQGGAITAKNPDCERNQIAWQRAWDIHQRVFLRTRNSALELGYNDFVTEMDERIQLFLDVINGECGNEILRWNP